MSSFLNLSNICAKLGQAIENDCGQISRCTLIDLFVYRAALRKSDSDFLIHGPEVFVRPAAVFSVYADWLTDIGVKLGFDCQNDELAGQWITSDMAAIRSITAEILKLAVSGMICLDQTINDELSYRACEAFITQRNAEDGIGKTQGHLDSKRRGLKLVRTH